MYEQEYYKQILKKLIEAAETRRIQTSEDLLQQLIHELSRDGFSYDG